MVVVVNLFFPVRLSNRCLNCGDNPRLMAVYKPVPTCAVEDISIMPGGWRLAEIDLYIAAVKIREWQYELYNVWSGREAEWIRGRVLK
jgi:hypothetical protein